MKFDITEWSFFDLLWEYLEIKYYFKSDEPWEEYPWFTQVELKKIVAVLNAFTGGNYIVETMEGKKKIDEVFCTGFGHYFDFYTEKQMLEIKKSLKGHGLFRELGKTTFPAVGYFYKELFKTFEAGHKYITKFDFLPLNIKKDPVFQILNGFKFERQDKLIYRFNRKVCEAMMILLGEKFRRTFTTAELIANYGYPNVEHAKIEKAKIAYKDEGGDSGYR